MKLDQFLDIAAIPLVTFCVLIYYSIRILVKGNISLIRKPNDPPVKDEKMYAKTAGKLILMLAFATALMTALLFWNVYIAVTVFVIFTIIFVILWSRMNKKFCN